MPAGAACPPEQGSKTGVKAAAMSPTDYDSFTPDSPLVPVARFITLCHREIRSKPMACAVTVAGKLSCKLQHETSVS